LLPRIFSSNTLLALSSEAEVAFTEHSVVYNSDCRTYPLALNPSEHNEGRGIGTSSFALKYATGSAKTAPKSKSSLSIRAKEEITTEIRNWLRKIKDASDKPDWPQLALPLLSEIGVVEVKIAECKSKAVRDELLATLRLAQAEYVRLLSSARRV
jgi:hypothetical protein